jgi:uncharacterized protein
MAGALLTTLALLSRKAAPWLRGLRKAALLSTVTRGAEIKVAPQDVDEAIFSIHPVAFRLLGTFWIVVALLRSAIVYPSLAPPLPLIFIAITLASVLGYLYWIYRGATDAERLYPYRPSLNLLALRVFGSPNLSDFLNLSDAWQWIGTRQLLDGPDTAGHKAKDLLNYLSGRIDRSIKADATELHEALDAFSYAVILGKGDEIMSGMTAFARRERLRAAHFTAIGAIERGLFGWFDKEVKAYRNLPVNDQAEVVSLVDDIGLVNGGQAVHVHAVVILADGTAWGGHLLEANVWPTLEVFLTDYPAPLLKELDAATGLYLFEPEARG